MRSSSSWDVGSTNAWRMDDVLPSAEIVRRIAARCRSSRSARTTPAKSPSAGATSDGAGEIGVISSVTQAFCASCNACAFSTGARSTPASIAQAGHDLKSSCRGAATSRSATRSRRLQRRADRYSEIRRPNGKATQSRDVVHRW